MCHIFPSIRNLSKARLPNRRVWDEIPGQIALSYFTIVSGTAYTQRRVPQMLTNFSVGWVLCRKIFPHQSNHKISNPTQMRLGSVAFHGGNFLIEECGNLLFDYQLTHGHLLCKPLSLSSWIWNYCWGNAIVHECVAVNAGGQHEHGRTHVIWLWSREMHSCVAASHQSQNTTGYALYRLEINRINKIWTQVSYPHWCVFKSCEWSLTLKEKKVNFINHIQMMQFVECYHPL